MAKPKKEKVVVEEERGSNKHKERRHSTLFLPLSLSTLNTMSSNSRTSSEPPAKRAKVSHKSNNEVVDDVSISDEAPTMTGSAAADEAALAACSSKARELDGAIELREALGRRVKVEGERREHTLGAENLRTLFLQ